MNELKTILYKLFESMDDLGMSPSTMAEVLATYVDDKTDTSQAVEAIEESAQLLRKWEQAL